MRAIDLRSDTVTRPTPEMRRAMYETELGDDGLEGDPTTGRLQEMAAEMMGAEAGLLVASGSMGNLVCALAHRAPGQAMLVGETSHMTWSVGQAATHPTYAQIEVRRLSNEGGKRGPEDIAISVDSEAGGRHGPGVRGEFSQRRPRSGPRPGLHGVRCERGARP